MIQRLGDFFYQLARRFLPHPFVFALLLTFLAFALALVWGRASPLAIVRSWQEGVFTPSLFVFMAQMCLVLVTGHALASTRPVGRALARLASLPRSGRSAVALTAFVAMATALFNWGLGLIVGALLAREVARSARERGIALHYPLVVAAGYTGLMIWHGGFSGSAPLMVATAGHFLEKEIGIIPVTRTLLSPGNILTRCALLVAAPALLALMVPREPGRVVLPPDARPTDAAAAGSEEAGETTLADRLQRSRLLALLGAALAALYAVLHFASKGIGGLDLNMIILVFLAAGLALHGTPARYAHAVDEAAPGVSGILLQFPFYFGIMGIMKGAGLIALLAQAFIAISEALARAGIPTSGAYSITTFVAASVVNTFVPSGGGQWTVQGPIAVEAAAHLGVPVHKAVLAVVYGDEFTNMIQPFWTLPILAITGVKASDILGYTALLMLLVTPIFVLGLLV